MFFLFSIFFFAEYQEPMIRWPPIRFQTLYQGGNFKAVSFRNPSIQYLIRDNSILLVNDISYSKDNTLPNKVGIVARKGYINYNNNGSSNIDWQNPYLITDPVSETGDSNPATVVDQKTGTILCVWNGNQNYQSSTAQDPAHIYFSKSTDNGLTWSPKKDITSSLYSSLCTNCQVADHKNWKSINISSGTGLQLRDGRIIFPCVVRHKFSYGETRNFMLITDDLGENWFMNNDGPVTNVIQAKAVQLNNYEVLLSIGQNGSQKVAYSRDRAETWYSASPNNNIKNGNSNSDIKRFTSAIDGYNKNRILLTVPNNEGGKMEKLTMMVSYDEGTSWPYKKIIEFVESSYSSIATTPNGDILVYYEKIGSTPYDLVVANFSLDWLTDGVDTYKKPQNLRWCLSSEQTSTSGRLCPKGTYYINYSVFDNQIEAFPIYAEDFQVGFIDAFRDFTIDLSRGGMKTAIISNHNDKRIKVDLIGTSKTNRSLAFNGNIDITVSKSNYEYIDFELDDKAKLSVKNSRSALLEDEKSLTNQHNEKTVSISVALAVSSLLFVIGLMIVFAVDHVFLNKKVQINDDPSSLLQ